MKAGHLQLTHWNSFGIASIAGAMSILPAFSPVPMHSESNPAPSENIESSGLRQPAISIALGSAHPFGGFSRFKQTNPAVQEPLCLHSGVYHGDTVETRIAFRRVIERPGASRICLHLGDYELGKGSFLSLKSLKDGREQHLTAQGLVRGKDWTPYFRGDAVELTLHVAESDFFAFVFVDAVAHDADPGRTPQIALGRFDGPTMLKVRLVDQELNMVRRGSAPAVAAGPMGSISPAAAAERKPR